MASLPFRFLTPFPCRASRRLRNSLRSDILAAQQSWVPSKHGKGRLNLQWSLKPFQIGHFLSHITWRQQLMIMQEKSRTEYLNFREGGED